MVNEFFSEDKSKWGRQKKNCENKITKLIMYTYQLEYKTVQSMEIEYSQLFVNPLCLYLIDTCFL